MPDIPDIQRKFFIPIQGIAAVDLCPSGDARPEVVTLIMFVGAIGQILNEQGPGTDEAHFAFEDIPQFRKFVETGRAEDVAKFRFSLRIGKQLTFRISGIGHGAKLIDCEGFALFPSALLREDDRASEF